MKKEQVFENQVAMVNLVKRTGQKPGNLASEANPNVRNQNGKLVWRGSPLTKELLMRLIERVQKS